VLEKAYAKINLALDVKSRREDGYHELETIMVPVSFFDELNYELIKEETSFSCNKKFISFDERNSIYNMYKYLKDNYDLKHNYHFHLKKQIPTRAGLAGGSSDAAAILRIIDREEGLHLDAEAKKKAALAVGADVMFCVYQRPALVKGIGEQLEFFDVKAQMYILLVKPKSGVSTKEAFDNLDLNICDHPDINLVKEKLEKGYYSAMIDLLGNSLEQPSLHICPEIAALKQEILDFGFDVALMSGSGSTVFGLTQNPRLINEANNYFFDSGYFVRKCEIVNNK